MMVKPGENGAVPPTQGMPVQVEGVPVQVERGHVVDGEAGVVTLIPKKNSVAA